MCIDHPQDESTAGEEASAPQLPEGFFVHDEGTANWVIRKIVEARAYAQHVSAWAEKEQTRARRDEEWFLFHYGGQLMDWLRRRIEEQGGRRKSVSLPAGVAGFRKEGPKIVIDDEGLVLAWAKENHPDLVCIIERISKSRLNDYVEATGEIPNQGLHIEPEKEKFYVR